MRNIIEELFGRTDGQIDMQTLGGIVAEFVDTRTFNTMLRYYQRGDLTCMEVVDWFKAQIRDSLSLSGLQFHHLVFPFSHPTESIFSPR